MGTIYRKYRPQTFAEITGQEHVVTTITNQIITAKTAHAYLFSGPRGTGKTTIARLLAKAINCQNRAVDVFEPCNTCSSCTEITAGHNIDVIEIDAASHTGVDNVRENVIENAQFKPTKSRYKVFIIDEVHMLSVSAFNALLKTLEEPPSHVAFILATTEPHKLPATIISRCQRFTFKKVGHDQMLKRLQSISQQENVHVDDKVLKRIINKSDGCVRDAEGLLGQLLSLNLPVIGPAEAEIVLPTSPVETVVQWIEQVVNKQPAEALHLLDKLTEDGVNIEQFAYDALEVLRTMMVIQASPKQSWLHTDYSEKDTRTISLLSAAITPTHLVAMIDTLISRKREIKVAPVPQLPLELFVVQYSALDQETTTAPASITNSAVAAPVPSAPEEKKQSPITQTIKDTITYITHRPLKTTFNDITAKWNEVVQLISSENHSLSFIVAMSQLRELKDHTLTVTVPYTFHRDKLMETKTKKHIEEVLAQTFGEHILLACEVQETAASSQSANSELAALAADFGGEIVN